MKVCERCGVEIETKDGENRCVDCESVRCRRPKSRRRGLRESVLRDFGLVKVRGGLGGTYWE